MKISVVKFGNYLEPPLVSPLYSGGRKWLMWGEDNLYPQHLVELLDSPTHNSIVRTKVKLTCGDGLMYDKDDVALDSFLKRIKANELIYRSATDLVNFGGFSWQVLWSLDLTAIAGVRHFDFSRVRMERADTEETVNGYYLSGDWNYYSRSQYKPYFIERFSPVVRDANKPYLFYYGDYVPAMNFYPQPSYYGGVKSITAEIYINRHIVNTAANSFNPSGFLFAPDLPTDEERQEFVKALEREYGGSENSGKLIVVFGSTSADGNALNAQFQALQSDKNADVYNNMLAEVKQQIITAHQLTSPTLAGLSGSGSLSGNANEILNASELFYQTVIKDYQDKILTKLQYLLEVNNLSTDIAISNIQPVKFRFSEGVIKDVLTKDELRAELGYEPLEQVQTKPQGTLFGNGGTA